MAIIDPVPSQTEPLAQGDILKGVALHFTENVKDNGGVAKKLPQPLCLIVSRDCIALRDEFVTVVAIDKYKRTPGDFEDFDECLAFFNDVRDGLSTPDQLYLGQIEGYDGCFCARFDRVFTIEVPTDSQERDAFTKALRIGRLNTAFIHDLHQRVTRAFSSSGFDDYEWFSTQDLRTVIAYADKEESKMSAQLKEAEAQLNLGNSGFTNSGQKAAKEREAATLREKLAKVREKTKPYRDALAGRPAQGNES